MTTTVENKAIVRRTIEELWNQGNYGAIGEYVAADFVWHDTEITSREAFEDYVSAMRAAFPDIHVAIFDQVAERDRVVLRCMWKGTHQGEWMGIAPTGKEVTWTMIIICRVTDEKIVEAWDDQDVLGLLQQIGAVPPLG
jgi:predicted ester cyclase